MEVNSKVLRKQDSGSNTDEAAAAQKLDGLVQKVTAGGITVTAQVEADEALINVLELDAKQESEAKRAEEERYSDTAKLSNESRAYNRGVEEEAVRQREVEALLNQVWRLLEGWQPQPDLGLWQDVKELGDLYRQLIQEIMRLYTQSEAGLQADRVNGLLLEIIDKLGGTRFPNLLQLMEKYGEQEGDDRLRACVLQKITGRTVSYREVARARGQQAHWEAQRGIPSRQGKEPMEEGPVRGAVGRGTAGREEGILYSRGKGKQVSPNLRYRESVRSVEQFRFHINGGSGKTGFGAGLRPFQDGSYSIKDIERSERFLAYITRDGNLLCNPGITARNEELLGFLMAVTMAKVQIFSDHGGVGRGLALDIQSALERLFRHCLNRAAQPQPSQGEKYLARLDSSVIQRIYYRVMELIQHMEKAETGIKKGLEYAWELFVSKKENEEYKRYRRYGKNAGFFLKSIENKDEIKELNYGAELLDKDWRKFLGTIGQSRNELLQIMVSKSPWGAVLEPERPPIKGFGGPYALALLALAGGCLTFAAAGLFYTAFLR